MDINRYHCPSFVYQMGDDSQLYRDATEKVVVKSYI